MKVRELLDNGIRKLNMYNIAESNLKAKLLLSYLLGVSKERLVTIDLIDLSVEKNYFEYIDQLCGNKPIQYITHKQEFMGMDFYVDENVLIPQPDTEILVEEVLKICKANDRVLDLCTGSGAIAISLAANCSKLQMYASDISPKALTIAKKNATNNLLVNNIEFIKSDLFNNVKNKYDIIVSNPPYIETNVIKALDKDVQHEPILALDGGKDGLDFYRKIAVDAKKHLNKYLCLEIGYDQKENVEQILELNGYKNTKCIKDLSGNDRVIISEV